MFNISDLTINTKSRGLFKEKSNSPQTIISTKHSRLNETIPKFELPIEIGTIKTRRPAFTKVKKRLNGEFELFVSCFDIRPFKSHHEVKKFKNISKALENKCDLKDLYEETLTNDLLWPNDLTYVKMSGREGLLVSTGFFLPGFRTGEVSFIDLNKNKKIKITKDKEGWFYHRAIPFDLKNDGNIGVLTARSNKSLVPTKTLGELVWLEKTKETGRWKENILIKGPDVHFNILDLDNNGTKGIVAAEFFSDKLSLIWFEKNKFKRKVLDQKLGNPFDVQAFDINNDGKKELLVTNHCKNGSVFVYEIPDDIKRGQWKRHEILSNIKIASLPIKPEHAPGKAIPFYPRKNMKGKPYIIVAGDGSHKVHMLIPKQPLNPKNWDYHEEILYSGKHTVGQISVGNFNKDGTASIFIPLYEKNEIKVYKFQ